jgi:hypothetical protein
MSIDLIKNFCEFEIEEFSLTRTPLYKLINGSFLFKNEII